MKKWLTAMILCAVLLCTTALAESYSATATGFDGPVTVTVGVEDGKIVSCEIDAPQETEAIGGAAAKSLAAAIAENGGPVDSVAGATMTSNAVAAALADAMRQAGLADSVEAAMQPGTYTGSAHGFSCIDKITVHVTVDENSIVALELEDTFKKDQDSYENPYMAKGAFALLEERILEAQSIGVDSVTGATGSSTGIKNAIRDALSQAYQAAGLDEAAASDAINGAFMTASAKTDGYVELEADVIVVGAGASGTIASLTAQEAGANVINIEKTFRWGGQSMLTGGPKVFSALTTEEKMDETVAEYETVTAESRFGTDAIWNDAAYQQEHADVFVDFNHAAYRAVIPASGVGAKTLMEAGVQFSEGFDFSKLGELLAGGPPAGGMPAMPGPGADMPAMPGAEGDVPAGDMPAMPDAGAAEDGMPDIAALMGMPAEPLTPQDIDGYTDGQNINYMDAEDGYEKAYNVFVQNGGTALLETRVTALIYGEDGAIVGVEAQADNGTRYQVRAKAVILATGGFGGNEEMVDQHTPGGSDWIYYGWQGNDGDGINMAFDAGAKAMNMDAYPMSHQRMGAEFVTVFELEQTEDGALWSPNDLPVVLAVNNDGVYVTRDGTPFLTEDIHSKMGGFSGSMGSYYLGSRYYAIYSAAQLRAYAEQGIADTTMGFQNTGEGIPANYALGDWIDTVLDYAASRGWAWKVSTLEEGDEALGFEAGTLAAAYALDATELNRADDEYYYVIACTGLSISSCGGIEVNEKMQAVREDGGAIENLFVVGNDSFGNIMATAAEYSIGGDAGMWCFGSGVIAGGEAAALALAE